MVEVRKVTSARRRHILLFLFCVVNSLANSGPFDCKPEVSGVRYDLTILGNDERTIERNRDRPPSTMHDILRFNLCRDLTKQDGVKDTDQCPQGTRACFTTTNKKDNEQDRVISVIPLAQSSNDYTIQATSAGSEKGITIVLNGASYPADGPKQSLKVVMYCAKETQAPKLIDYNNAQATIEWHVVEACGLQGTPDAPNQGGGSPTDENVGGSSMGWFFFILLLIIGAYFGLGAYYNYNHYGASGWDLVPHRDFWRDVPYLIRDLISQLFSSGRSSRGGYTSV